MRVARSVARHAVLFLFLFLALAPATVLAFNPPNPNGPGNHLGEYLHNPHVQASQLPPPPVGGSNAGRGGGGVTDALAIPQSGAEGPNLTALPAFRFQAKGVAIPALESASSVGHDAWWLVVILAAFLAANVVLAVLYLSRGGNYVYTRVLRMVPSSA